MSKVISMRLSTRSIQQAIKEIRRYKVWMHERLQVLCNRLADIGVETASAIVAEIPEDELGSSDGGVTVEPVYSSESADTVIGAAVHIRGSQVAFLEFSAGIRYGTDAYPLESGAPYGMGTYPGAGHWNDPRGWWYLDPQNPKAGPTGYVHTYGNRAYMPGYYAGSAIALQVESVAREVFGG